MRIKKLLSLLGFFVISSFCVSAHADTLVSCAWMTLGGASYPGGWTSVDGCYIGNPQAGPVTLVAQRTKTNTGSCTISVYSPYTNIGSCQSPNFVIPNTLSTSSAANSAPSSSSATAQPQTTVYVYDALGRIVGVKENGSIKEGYMYDKAGNRCNVSSTEIKVDTYCP